MTNRQILVAILIGMLIGFFAVLYSPAHADNVCPQDTHQEMPDSSDTFLPDLQTYLCDEESNLYTEQFHDFVFSGGFVDPPSPAAGLALTPGAPLLATVEGHYITESGQVTLTNNADCWIIADDLQSGSIGLFNRVTGTHYLTYCAPQNSVKPALPEGTIWLMRARTQGNAITLTHDLRSRVPWGVVAELTKQLPTSDRTVDAAFSQEDGCFYLDTGEGWTALVDSRNMQMVTYNYSFDPGSISDGAVQCTTFAFPGAAGGMRCLATHYVAAASNQALAWSGNAILVTAAVSANDTVKVCALNKTGGAFDGVAADMKISCWR